MTAKSNDPRTPGQFIRDVLAEKGWTQRTLAAILEIGESAVARHLSGERPLDAEFAIALQEALGVPAETLLGLQCATDLACARKAGQSKPRTAVRARLLGELPVAEMIRRGWLGTANMRDVRTVETALAKYFGVAQFEDIAFSRRADDEALCPAGWPLAQQSWLLRARHVAGNIRVEEYSPSSASEVVPRLHALVGSPDGISKVPRILAECGIRLVIVEALVAAETDGACFWLNDCAPVIAMTLRVDRLDHFWFVLRHELEHVLRLHGLATPILDAGLDGDRTGHHAGVSDEERVANDAAREFCVSSAMLDAFVARKAPFISRRDILEYARTINVHPQILSRRIQHRTGKTDRFRAFNVGVRSALCPHAATDGWGIVAVAGPSTAIAATPSARTRPIHSQASIAG